MNIDRLYQEALNYLYGFIDNSLTHQKDITLKGADLSRMLALVEALGNPEQKYPTLHVAGSKGKGSVSALCATALQTAGYKVGLYTSPHLRDFEERIQINREPISRQQLVALINEMKPYVAAIPGLTTFEIATALAFLYFQREKVDIAVIEVGLGGRLDATNVITPLVSVITALYLEHTRILGNTLTEIAREKAGIIKPGVPVVVSPNKEEALRKVYQIAAEKGALVIQNGRDYRYEFLSASLEGQSFLVHVAGSDQPAKLCIRLLGPHQLDNATTAYAALQVLRDQGFPIDENAIREGFAGAEWPARFEILQANPPIVVDSAHNPDAARKLRETLDEFFPGRPVVIVFGVSEDKDVAGMVRELAPRTQLMICSKSTHPRAMDAEALTELCTTLGVPARCIENIPSALREAIRVAGDETLVLVTGSIFVAATARIAWLEKSIWESP